MKRVLCFVLAIIVCILCFSGCAPTPQKSEKIKIVATVFPPFDFARAIAGDRAQTVMLIRPGSESHSFEPTPADITASEECDLFIAIGGEGESWAQRLLESGENKKRKTLIMTDYINMIKSSDHHETENNHTHHHQYDEHIWTSPINAIKMSESIYNALCSIDSKNKEYYKTNFEALKEDLLSLDIEFKKLFENNSGKELVFGDRFPFLYLANEYNFHYHAAFPGCAEQSEPDINTLIQIIDIIKKHKVSTVFYTEFSNKKTANMLCDETGAKPLLLHSCHNVTKEEFNNNATYISLMKKNIKNLKTALKS